MVFVERAEKLKEILNIKTQDLESKHQKCLELVDKQNELELKIALKYMVDEKTNKPMAYDVNTVY